MKLVELIALLMEKCFVAEINSIRALEFIFEGFESQTINVHVEMLNLKF